jgi:tetratricopeptide (TPR) repeat protein
MSDANGRNRKRSRPEIDISTAGFGPKARTHLMAILCLIIFLATLVIFCLEPAVGWMIVLPIFGSAVFCFFGFIAWYVIVQRGALTWLRLAVRPARFMARGDAAGAELAYAKALARAKRFAPDDPRRGMMLFELAMYAKNQGRYQEGLALYEECVEILSKHEPLDYFTALNNYGICFISLKDFEAAQRILEKAIDLTLGVRKRQQNSLVKMPLHTVQWFECILRMNLVFLLMEMHELAEAELQLRQADAILPLLSKRTQAAYFDHYVGICALWEFKSGKLAEAASEIAEARNPDYSVCLSVRAKLHIVGQEFALAEQLLRKYQNEVLKKGILRRPDLLDHTLDLAEALFGQRKHDDAFASLQEARSIVADFAMPADDAWRKALATWHQRATELGRTKLAASLDMELAQAMATPNPAITILDKFRVPSQAPS